MKTNVSISLDDTERRLLADFIDNKKTKRLATRAEIITIARRGIERILIGKIAKTTWPRSPAVELGDKSRTNLVEIGKACLVNMAETPDPEDADHLADKSLDTVFKAARLECLAFDAAHTAAVKKRAARAFGPGD